MGNAPTAPRRPGAKALRLLAGTGIGMLLSLASHTGAYAFNEQIAGEFEHFVECKILLLTNPAEHASQCLPSRVPPFFGTLIEKGPPAAAVAEEPVCEGNLDGGICYSESCTEEQQEDPFYYCFEQKG